VAQQGSEAMGPPSQPRVDNKRQTGLEALSRMKEKGSKGTL
jgi:hypothetical protein